MPVKAKLTIVTLVLALSCSDHSPLGVRYEVRSSSGTASVAYTDGNAAILETVKTPWGRFVKPDSSGCYRVIVKSTGHIRLLISNGKTRIEKEGKYIVEAMYME